VFQLAPGAVVLAYVLVALLGAIVSVLSGALISTVFKLRKQRSVRYALLGSVGSVLTVILSATIPWPWNTLSTSLGPGVRLETAMDRFQHPYIAAIVVAIVLPALDQLIRSKRASPSQN